MQESRKRNWYKVIATYKQRAGELPGGIYRLIESGSGPNADAGIVKVGFGGIIIRLNLDSIWANTSESIDGCILLNRSSGKDKSG